MRGACALPVGLRVTTAWAGWEFSRIGEKTRLRGRLPQLQIKGGHRHHLSQRVLPEDCCGQMHGVVTAQSILPGQLIGARYGSLCDAGANQVRPVSPKSLQAGLCFVLSQHRHAHCFGKGGSHLSPRDDDCTCDICLAMASTTSCEPVSTTYRFTSVPESR